MNNRFFVKAFILCLLFICVERSDPAFFQGIFVTASFAQDQPALSLEERFCVNGDEIGCGFNKQSLKKDGYTPETEYQPCMPVATLFGQDICEHTVLKQHEREELIPHTHADGTDAFTESAKRNFRYERRIIEEAKNRLLVQIQRIALERKFGLDQLIPTTEQVKMYTDAHIDLLNSGHENNIKLRDVVVEILETKTVSENAQYELQGIKSTLDKSIFYYEQQQESQNSIPEEFQDMLDSSRHSMSQKSVQEWLINKRLYEAYGGALNEFNGIPFAVTGWLELINYIREDGAFKLKDNIYEGVLEEEKARLLDMFTFQGPAHAYYYENVFSSPDWNLRHKQKQSNLDALSKQLRALK